MPLPKNEYDDQMNARAKSELAQEAERHEAEMFWAEKSTDDVINELNLYPIDNFDELKDNGIVEIMKQAFAEKQKSEIHNCQNCKHEPYWGPEIKKSNYSIMQGYCNWDSRELRSKIPACFMISAVLITKYNDGSGLVKDCPTWEPKQ